MFKNNKHRIFLILSVLTFIIGPLLADNKLKWLIDTTGYESAIAIGALIIWAIFFLMWFLPVAHNAEEKHKKEMKNGTAPIFESKCTHLSGLASFVAEGNIKVFTDRVEFSAGNTHYSLPINRIVSADIMTQKQTEYITTQKLSRAVLGGLVFGDIGVLIGGAPKSEAVEITEKNLVITYTKDDDVQFIVLKNLPCNKVIRAIEQNVNLSPRHVEL